MIANSEEIQHCFFATLLTVESSNIVIVRKENQEIIICRLHGIKSNIATITKDLQKLQNHKVLIVVIKNTYKFCDCFLYCSEDNLNFKLINLYERS